MSPRHLHSSIEIPSGHVALPLSFFQCLSNIKFLDPAHKAYIGIIKRVTQLKNCIPILSIEQFIKIVSSSISDFILLHQKVLRSKRSNCNHTICCYRILGGIWFPSLKL
ncbi:AT-hook motif nuclear-localized protein 1 [Zea mays]|uniref:AT-hook motif nuclear-localized protein 1 n=1 Tax=Zea mays TaxID=4577 RepID=A0A1D6GZ90_MAIZE|nr:AT-hook motif nuclear-localized protein 1 [Zea mays]